MNRRAVFLTGATGTMGSATLKHMLFHLDRLDVTVLARNSKKNHKLLDKLVNDGKISVIWGDLTNYDDIYQGVKNADYVLHVGGMVSPMADHFPELSYRVNTQSARYIANAVLNRPDKGVGVKVVYIGSVAQLGFRHQPLHWGRSGDPVWAAKFDSYALSKIEAERIIADARLPQWVSLRQTGILANSIIKKGSDPITFHVPVNSVLEWVSDDDSGQLLCNLCLADLPENFWKHFYNIGGGKGFRLSNFEFEQLILKSMSCPDTRKCFDANWFATRNFHGMWYEDSDLLEDFLHFRSIPDADTYFKEFKKSLPWYFSLAAIVPAPIIKGAMKMIANKKPLGTLSWVKGHSPERLKAFFGSLEEWEKIPDWEHTDLSHPSESPVRLDHGYDESKPETELELDDMRRAASFRGGRCLSKTMTKGDLDTPLKWECAEGHQFSMSPRLVLLGGHWCPTCFGPDADYDLLARKNPFFAQVY